MLTSYKILKTVIKLKIIKKYKFIIPWMQTKNMIGRGLAEGCRRKGCCPFVMQQLRTPWESMECD